MAMAGGHGVEKGPDRATALCRQQLRRRRFMNNFLIDRTRESV
jgi:hypothetical protein